MSMPLLRALANSARTHISSLKSQSRKLHAAAADVFGQPYALDVCEHAVARANGFRSWREVARLAQQLGQDRSEPVWTIHHREPLHEACLQALYLADVEMDESRAVVMRGDPDSAAVPAVCLWAEQASAQKAPGVILIDTKAPTYQKTPIGRAAKELGLHEMFQGFRVIDTRTSGMHLVTKASDREWVWALRAGLSKEVVHLLDEKGILSILEVLLDKHGRRSQGAADEKSFSTYGFGYIASLLGNSKMVRHQEVGYVERTEVIDRFAHELDKPEINAALAAIQKLLRQLEDRTTQTGTVLNSEAKHRPTIVLFDVDDPVSAVLASVVQFMHFSPYVSTRSVHPFLYLSTEGRAGIPDLQRGCWNNIVVAGDADEHAPLWDNSLTRKPLFVAVTGDELVVTGKAVKFRDLQV